jgi:hypothetical protein
VCLIVMVVCLLRLPLMYSTSSEGLYGSVLYRMGLEFGTGCLSGGKTPSLARLASQPRQSSRMAFFFFSFLFLFFLCNAACQAPSGQTCNLPLSRLLTSHSTCP